MPSRFSTQSHAAIPLHFVAESHRLLVEFGRNLAYMNGYDLVAGNMSRVRDLIG